MTDWSIKCHEKLFMIFTKIMGNSMCTPFMKDLWKNRNIVSQKLELLLWLSSKICHDLILIKNLFPILNIDTKIYVLTGSMIYIYSFLMISINHIIICQRHKINNSPYFLLLTYKYMTFKKKHINYKFCLSHVMT